MSAAISRSILALVRNQAGNYSSYGQLTCNSGTGASSNQIAIPLAELVASSTTTPNTVLAGAPHLAWFSNCDLTNFIRIVDRNVSSNAVIAQLAPGDFEIHALFNNCSPYAVAESGSPILEFMITGY